MPVHETQDRGLKDKSEWEGGQEGKGGVSNECEGKETRWGIMS